MQLVIIFTLLAVVYALVQFILHLEGSQKILLLTSPITVAFSLSFWGGLWYYFSVLPSWGFWTLVAVGATVSLFVVVTLISWTCDTSGVCARKKYYYPITFLTMAFSPPFGWFAVLLALWIELSESDDEARCSGKQTTA